MQSANRTVAADEAQASAFYQFEPGLKSILVVVAFFDALFVGCGRTKEHVTRFTGLHFKFVVLNAVFKLFLCPTVSLIVQCQFLCIIENV